MRPPFRPFLLALVVAACSSERSPTVETVPLGELEVRIQHDGPPGVIITRGGRLLADLTSFGARSGTATYETLYGAFKILEEAGPWSSATRITGVSREGDAISFRLEANGAPLASAQITSPEPGHVLVRVIAEGTANRAKMGLRCGDRDHFAGLGAQAMDVDHRGQNVPLFVSEPGIGKREDDEYDGAWFIKGRKHASGVPIPAVVTGRGQAWVLDTYAHATFDLCKANPLEASVEAWEKELRFHVFDGPSPLEALSRMTTFVGRPWMPPPWMFAPWNDAILGPENVLKFARFLRDNQIPTSAIWSEDFRGGIWQPYGYRIAPNWRPDRTLYPEPEKLVADLRALGITWQLYFNPHVIEKADVATDARDKRVLLHKKSGEPFQWAGADGTFGLTAMLDLTNPASRDWAKGLLKEAIALGSLGWMADFGEWMPIDDAMVASGEDPMLVHNRYPLLWQEVNRDAMKEAGALDRMCVYHRSGHLRSQGTTLIMWAGDQRTSFEKDDGLPTIIPIGLGLAATGFPFYAHDIAGYQFLGNKPPEAASKELFYRWTELGAFTPVMRTHHGIKVKDNWTLDKDAETTAMWRRYAQLHTQLYPYWRGLAVRAVKEGRPLWIPMGFLHPDDEDAWAVRDQFYLGDALLVAPVVEEGASGRRVVFPRGRFAPLLEPGAAMFGPAKEYVSAPLDKIPVYLAAGGIVPTTKEIPMTLFEGVEGVPGLEVTRGDRVVYVGLGADGTFVEENGARYTLRGTRSEVPKEEVILTGNGRYQGDGFVLELEGHPPDRKTQLVFR